jgi:hypothetical protein
VSFLVHDLRCAAGHLEVGAVYRRSDGPSACPVVGCGEARSVTYLPRAMGGGSALPETDTWVPLVHCGETYHTRSDWNAFKAKWARNQGVDPSQVEEVSNADRVVRGEEALHRSYQTHKRRGFGENELRDYRENVARYGRRA